MFCRDPFLPRHKQPYVKSHTRHPLDAYVTSGRVVKCSLLNNEYISSYPISTVTHSNTNTSQIKSSKFSSRVNLYGSQCRKYPMDKPLLKDKEQITKQDQLV